MVCGQRRIGAALLRLIILCTNRYAARGDTDRHEGLVEGKTRVVMEMETMQIPL